MDRREFMKELEYLLSDISEEERREALKFYEDYFDEAGQENESHVILELGEPSRIAAMIKDGLKGNFDDGIHAGNNGFSNDDYQRNYEVIHAKTQKKSTRVKKSFQTRWNEIDSHDRIIFIVLGILAFVPVSSLFFGPFEAIFGIGISVFGVFMALIFGIWIITIVLHIVAGLLIVIGVIQLFTLPGAAFICLGVSFIIGALARISGKAAVWFFKDCIPSIANAIADGFGKIFQTRGA